VNELEQVLLEAGRRIEYPPTPELAASVAARLASVTPARERPLARRRLVLALALLAVAVGAAFAVPGARTAILEWLGLRGATVQRVETLPETQRQGAPAAAGLRLGTPVTLAQARARVSFAVAVPETLGEPDEVYVAFDVPGGRVSLVYLPGERLPKEPQSGIGLLLTEFRGANAPEFVGKLAAGGTRVEEVTVAGGPGIWLSGEPHEVFFRDARGEIRTDTIRLAGNTLLWEREGLLLRVESALTREQAIRVAGSVR
jgi:hypothetical protein